jgi:RNA polymerase sigma-70 factor, ECF subfamily
MKYEDYIESELLQVVQKKAKGHESAFNELYERHSYKLYNHCRFISFSESDAEEIFQQVWVKFHESCLKKTNIRNIKSYLFQTANNIYKNRIRDQKSTVSLNEDGILIADIEFYTDLQTSLEQTELFELVKLNVNRMPEKYRTVFIMNKFEGIPCPDIAEILNISTENAKKRLVRANTKLMKLLEPYIEEFSD